MFWDCLTCDYGFYLPGSKQMIQDSPAFGPIYLEEMATHEIYHHLWMGYEIDVLTGLLIDDGVQGSRHDGRSYPSMEDVVRRAGKRD